MAGENAGTVHAEAVYRIAAVAGGGLMASGGLPFNDALYLTPAGQWLDFAAYQQAVGSSPSTVPYMTTIARFPAAEA
jgi:hypothetical protein